MDTTFIYALCEPDTGEVRYVGKANNPKARYRGHLSDGKSTHKTNWIKSLKNRGLCPRLELLLEIPRTEWQFWERDMITTFREAGCELVNGTEGGEGGCHGKEKSEAFRQRLREVNLGKKHSDETRRKLSAGQIGRKLSEVGRQNLGKAKLGNKNMLGHSHTSESREKMKVAMRLAWARRKAKKNLP